MPPAYLSAAFGKYITELRQKHKLAVLLDVANLARATYYCHFKHTEKPDKYEKAKRRISTILEENKGRIGHRRITVVLHADQVEINQKTVLKIMRQLGLFCKVRMSKHHSYRGEIGTIAPDLLGRNFEATHPNQKCLDPF